jgi:hypothetical protein
MSAAALSVPLRALPLVAFARLRKYVFFGHFILTLQCTNMCTLVTSALPFSAQICVLRPLKVNSGGE